MRMRMLPVSPNMMKSIIKLTNPQLSIFLSIEELLEKMLFRLLKKAKSFTPKKPTSMTQSISLSSIPLFLANPPDLTVSLKTLVSSHL
jgi:hypothetical protein